MTQTHTHTQIYSQNINSTTFLSIECLCVLAVFDDTHTQTVVGLLTPAHVTDISYSIEWLLNSYNKRWKREIKCMYIPYIQLPQCNTKKTKRRNEKVKDIKTNVFGMKYAIAT